MGKLAQPYLAPRRPDGPKNAISAYSLGCVASARTHKKLEKSWGDITCNHVSPLVLTRGVPKYLSVFGTPLRRLELSNILFFKVPVFRKVCFCCFGSARRSPPLKKYVLWGEGGPPP